MQNISHNSIEQLRKIEDKEKIFRTFLENIFKINPEGNDEFDRQHEQLNENFMMNNRERASPFRYADIRRVDNNNPLTKPIEVWEIKR